MATATVIRSAGIELAYEAVGDPADPPVVLVAGLGAQLVSWRAEFCRALADRGYHVVRFDNRDVGLSTKFPDGGYAVADMAHDLASFIDALSFGSAHIVGQSLGGLIAQALVVRDPGRVRSLCLISSISNLSHLGPAAAAMATPDPPAWDRDAAVEQCIARESLLASPDYPLDAAWIREQGGLMWDRGWNPQGTAHQLDAIIRAPDYAPDLRSVAVPTLVIHGQADPLVSPAGGRALAEAIPGAELHMFPGMGHDLPSALWREIIDLIAANAARGRAHFLDSRDLIGDE